MKHLATKLIFIVILLIGISSFVAINKSSTQPEKEVNGNVRFDSEMDSGFIDRE